MENLGLLTLLRLLQSLSQRPGNDSQRMLNAAPLRGRTGLADPIFGDLYPDLVRSLLGLLGQVGNRAAQTNTEYVRNPDERPEIEGQIRPGGPQPNLERYPFYGRPMFGVPGGPYGEGASMADEGRKHEPYFAPEKYFQQGSDAPGGPA